MPGPYGAEFIGKTYSSATAWSAVAGVDGRLKGALRGLAMAGPLVDEARDSLGGRVDCDLLMEARSEGGSDAITGKAVFRVDDEWGGKIKSAVDASLDGDLIKVAPGTYRENLVLDKSLTIRGSGDSQTIIDGSRNRTVVSIGIFNPGASVALSGMTIQNGWAGSPLSEYPEDLPDGGGVWNNGTLSLEDSRIYKNYGGSFGRGAGIYNAGMLRAKNCEISQNTGGYILGGGIYNDMGAEAILKQCRITDNDAVMGGGVNNSLLGYMVIRDSKISENLVQDGAYGGGIANSGTMFVKNSDISSNRASGSLGISKGGGIWNKGSVGIEDSSVSGNTVSELSPEEGGALGGGIYNEGMAIANRITILGNHGRIGGGVFTNSYFSASDTRILWNIADVDGGGIFNDRGYYSLFRSTVAQNKPNDIVGPSLPH